MLGRGVGSELRDRLAGAESADRVPLSPTQLFFYPPHMLFPGEVRKGEMSPSRARVRRLLAALSRCSRTPPQTLAVGISVPMGNTPILIFFLDSIPPAQTTRFPFTSVSTLASPVPTAGGERGSAAASPPGYGDNAGCATPPSSPHSVGIAVPRRPSCDVGLGGERGSRSGAFPPQPRALRHLLP